MAGWIKIHRDIQQHWIAQDMEKFGWWIDLLLLASYEDNKALLGNRITEVKRGQFIASLRFLAERWNASKDKINAFLKLLAQDGMITKESDRNTTLITICNYESYQDIPGDFETPLRHLQDTSETPSRQTKEIQEVKEINITNNRAHAHEETVTWNEVTESGFLERFKAQGSAREIMRITGKSKAEVDALLDVYIAKRKLSDRGHKDFSQFCSLFLWAVQNNKIAPPAQPKQEKKVISGQAIFDLYK